MPNLNKNLINPICDSVKNNNNKISEDDTKILCTILLAQACTSQRLVVTYPREK